MNIIAMLSRMLLQRATRWGIRKGTDAIASRSAGKAAAGKMTPAARAQAKDMRLAVKRARQAARITRRMGR